MLVEEQFQNCTNGTARLLFFKLAGGGRNLTGRRKHESAEI